MHFKEKQFCLFMFAFLLNGGSTLKKRICSPRANSLFSEKTRFGRAVSSRELKTGNHKKKQLPLAEKMDVKSYILPVNDNNIMCNVIYFYLHLFNSKKVNDL